MGLLIVALFPLILGAAFLFVSRPRVWRCTHKKALQINPVYRWSERRFAKATRKTRGVTRIAMAAIGVILVSLAVSLALVGITGLSG